MFGALLSKKPLRECDGEYVQYRYSVRVYPPFGLDIHNQRIKVK